MNGDWKHNFLCTCNTPSAQVNKKITTAWKIRVVSPNDRHFYLITPLATETILKSFKRTAFTRMVTHYFTSTYTRIFLCQISSFLQACRLPTRHVSKLTAWLTSFLFMLDTGLVITTAYIKPFTNKKGFPHLHWSLWMKGRKDLCFCDGFINFQRACAFLLVVNWVGAGYDLCQLSFSFTANTSTSDNLFLLSNSM